MRMKHLIAAALTALTLSGCSLVYRIDIPQGNYVEQKQVDKLRQGMTREQVLMALGYPISSENPDLSADLWRYWMSSFAEFQVQFDGNGRVREITTDANTRNLVWVP